MTILLRELLASLRRHFSSTENWGVHFSNAQKIVKCTYILNAIIGLTKYVQFLVQITPWRNKKGTLQKCLIIYYF